MKRQYAKHPGLFVGCYRAQPGALACPGGRESARPAATAQRTKFARKLVGICLGFIMKRVAKDAVILGSIAVDAKYQKLGIGSRMLKFFHGQVRKAGWKKVSVAAAAGYVERFYIRNGYVPECILVRARRRDLPKGYRNFPFRILQERGFGSMKKLYVEAKKYSPSLRGRLKKKFHAYEANCIFGKKI